MIVITYNVYSFFGRKKGSGIIVHENMKDALEQLGRIDSYENIADFQVTNIMPEKE